MVALVIALQPIATGALSGLMTGEKTRKVQWLGLVIGFSGVAFSVIFRMKMDNEASLFGYLILLGSVVSISIANLIQRQMELKNAMNKLRTEQSLFYQSMATASAAFIPAVFFEGLSAEWNMEFTLSLSWLIIGVSLLAYGLMGKLLERISATKVSSLFYLGPPVTMIMAWIVLGDKIKFTDILGLLIVFSGLMLTQTEPDKYSKHFRRSQASTHRQLQPKLQYFLTKLQKKI
jgi:drug/metabolite transporter (DMT)-like permease